MLHFYLHLLRPSCSPSCTQWSLCMYVNHWQHKEVPTPTSHPVPHKEGPTPTDHPVRLSLAAQGGSRGEHHRDAGHHGKSVPAHARKPVSVDASSAFHVGVGGHREEICLLYQNTCYLCLDLCEGCRCCSNAYTKCVIIYDFLRGVFICIDIFVETPQNA